MTLILIVHVLFRVLDPLACARARTALSSMRERLRSGQPPTCRDPSGVGFEGQSEPLIGDPEIAVRALRHGFRRDNPHLLRHHADIGGMPSVVDEAIEAETVVQPADEHDVVLEADVGTAPASATSPAHSAASAATHAAAPTHRGA